MVGVDLPEAIAGVLLGFVVPGYTLTKALFPEWRIRGPEAPLRLVETLTLSLVLSVVLTVLVGYVLLTAAPGGFQAYWNDPVLEAALAGVAAVGFAAGWLRGAYRREPPVVAPPPASGAGEEDAWEVMRELERLGREERRLNHHLRTHRDDPPELARLRQELDRVRALREQLQERREGEYAA